MVSSSSLKFYLFRFKNSCFGIIYNQLYLFITNVHDSLKRMWYSSLRKISMRFFPRKCGWTTFSFRVVWIVDIQLRLNWLIVDFLFYFFFRWTLKRCTVWSTSPYLRTHALSSYASHEENWRRLPPTNSRRLSWESKRTIPPSVPATSSSILMAKPRVFYLWLGKSLPTLMRARFDFRYFSFHH